MAEPEGSADFYARIITAYLGELAALQLSATFRMERAFKPCGVFVPGLAAADPLALGLEAPDAFADPAFAPDALAPLPLASEAPAPPTGVPFNSTSLFANCASRESVLIS
jgi:hypothetical protein